MRNLPDVYRSVDDIRTALSPLRRDGKKIALVPTMGALHAGHLSLVEKAKEHADIVIVSIFVNPKQFAPGEDFESYPRTENSDLEKLADHDVFGVFAPNGKEMYPNGYATTIQIDGPAIGLESEHRPHFFTGVATVVAKLLLAVMPDTAIFGEKDYQQLCVIKQLAKDLHLPTKILGAPTVREHDGLAMSSRNEYLNEQERTNARTISQTLTTARNALHNGENWIVVQKKALAALKLSGFTTDYFELRDEKHLGTPIDIKGVRILVAAKIGTTRLIDNIEV
ncbi:pantoate--beta-alanine ligase [Pseudovibrio sp. Tun.PSC04-5.I4]|uniref:pantoate--beta-alanine ligase n=1 Tax=Pseudovibrio sp. Tun.PSC04-5.I4 TaxID=1798213 RepID=UPI00088D0901|nr:pantoate--beta-alanine ligase [Pseudovibrio sp. Tun.PSC04-5.I4]SDR39229.1 pantothenate synthetase [Pseudovibrio sp. Tun.PSC04-5.I4]